MGIALIQNQLVVPKTFIDYSPCCWNRDSAMVSVSFLYCPLLSFTAALLDTEMNRWSEHVVGAKSRRARPVALRTAIIIGPLLEKSSGSNFCLKFWHRFCLISWQAAGNLNRRSTGKKLASLLQKTETGPKFRFFVSLRLKKKRTSLKVRKYVIKCWRKPLMMLYFKNNDIF